MNLEDQVTGEFAKELAREIDQQVMMSILVEAGWAEVSLDRFYNNRHAVDINLWCEDNIKEKWMHSGSTFIFESDKDAAWFALKWL